MSQNLSFRQWLSYRVDCVAKVGRSYMKFKNRKQMALWVGASLLLIQAGCSYLDPRYDMPYGREEEGDIPRFAKGPYIQSLTETQAVIVVDSTADVVKLAYGSDLKNLDQKKELLVKDAPRKSASGRYFSFLIRGLRPGTQIFYHLEGFDDEGKLIEAYPVSAFRMAPSWGQKFSFVVVGSSENDHTQHQLVMDSILKYRAKVRKHNEDLKEDGKLSPTTEALIPELFFHLGNFHTAVSDFNWNRFFKIERDVLSQMAFFPVKASYTVGRREEGTSFREIFRIPGKHDYYSYRYGNAAFIVIDSEDLWSSSTQVRFLEDQLKKASLQKGPLIVMMHRPLFSSGARAEEGKILQKTLRPLFEKYKVDLVLSGMEHFYERSKPIGGVTYVSTGGGGAPLYSPRLIKSKWSAISYSSYHFLLIEVDGDKFVLKALNQELEVFDILTINSRKHGP